MKQWQYIIECRNGFSVKTTLWWSLYEGYEYENPLRSFSWNICRLKWLSECFGSCLLYWIFSFFSKVASVAPQRSLCSDGKRCCCFFKNRLNFCLTDVQMNHRGHSWKIWAVNVQGKKSGLVVVIALMMWLGHQGWNSSAFFMQDVFL